jgi:hypothetical protein
MRQVTNLAMMCWIFLRQRDYGWGSCLARENNELFSSFEETSQKEKELEDIQNLQLESRIIIVFLS